MFESKERLGEQITALVDAVRALGAGRYACVLERHKVLFEAPAPEESQGWALRRFLEERSDAVFGLPAAMAGDGPGEDVFADWEDQFLVAVLNGRVALVVACPHAEPLRERAAQALKVLVDRLMRYNETWRLDAQGRGLFFGRARLDIVVVA